MRRGPARTPSGARRWLVGVLAVVALGSATVPASGTAHGQGPSTPVVTVVDPGRKPRAELRYTAPLGTAQEFRLRTYSNIGQTIGGQTRSGGTPNVVYLISATVAQVDPDGTRRVDYRYDDVQVAPSAPSAETFQEALDPIVGLTGSVTYTARGEVLSSTIAAPPDLRADVRQLVESLTGQAAQLTPPFPDEAVGPGARWRIATEATVGGIRLEQVVTYALEDADGDVVTLSSRTRQTAPRQTFTEPTTGTEVEVVSSRGTGTATTTMDLAGAVFPVGGNADVRVRQVLRSGGQKITQTVTTAAFFAEPAR